MSMAPEAVGIPKKTWLEILSQRILGLIFLFGFIVAFVGPPFAPDFYWVVTLIVHVFLILGTFRLAGGLAITAFLTERYITVDWWEKFTSKIQEPNSDIENRQEKDNTNDKDIRISIPKNDPNNDILQMQDIRHVIIIPNYKENLPTMCETLDMLSNHKRASSWYNIILAMEEGEEGAEEKAKQLISLYETQFLSMDFTVHPKNIPGEARGKSSNVAWSSKQYDKRFSSDEIRPKELMTVMDADTHLTEKYFDCIAYRYCTADSEKRTRMLFAPNLIFDRNCQEVPFVVRLADMAWSLGFISYFQMPVKFPCSVYTVSHQLAHAVGYWDATPESIGEDMHMALKCWTHLKMNLAFVPVYIPGSCSNVQDDTYFGSIMAKFDQGKRHLWASLDFGYTFTRNITQGCYRKRPFKALLCLYLLFEIFFQPFFGFYFMTGQYIFPQSLTPFGTTVARVTEYIRLALIPIALIVGISYERYHYVCCKYRVTVLKSYYERQKKQMAKDINFDNAKDTLGKSNSALNPDNDEEKHDKTNDDNDEKMIEADVAFRKWYNLADWLGLPFGLIFYYMIPAINAMIGQLFTNQFDYKVSLKPKTTKFQLPRSPSKLIVDDTLAAENIEMADKS